MGAMGGPYCPFVIWYSSADYIFISAFIFFPVYGVYIYICIYNLQIRMSRTNVVFVVLLISINLAVGQVVTDSGGTPTYNSAVGAMVDHFLALPVYKGTGVGNNPEQTLSITFPGTPFSAGEAVHAASSIVNMNPNSGGSSNYLHLEVSSLTVNAARTGATLNIKFSNADDGATFTKYSKVGFHTIFIGEKFNQYAIGTTTLHSGLARNTDMLAVTDNPTAIDVAQFTFASSQGTSPFNFAPDATTSTYCGVQKMAESDYRIHVGGCAKTIFMAFLTGFRQQKGAGGNLKITASSLLVKDPSITTTNTNDLNFVVPVVTSPGTAGYIYPDGLSIIYERNGANALSHVQFSLVFIGMRKFDSTNPDQVVANPDNFIATAGAYGYIVTNTLNGTPQNLLDGLLGGSATLNTKAYTVPDGNMGSVFCGLQTGFEIDDTDIQVLNTAANDVQLKDTGKTGAEATGAGCVLVADAPGLACTSTYSGLVSPTNIAPVTVGVPTPATVSPVSYKSVQYQTANDIQAYTYTISGYNAAGVTSTSTTLSRSFTLPAGTRQVVLFVQLKTFTDTTLATAQTPPTGKLQYKITIPQVPLTYPVTTLTTSSTTQKLVFTVPAGTTTITPTIQFLTGDITTADPITMATTVAFTPVVYTNVADGSNCGVACPDRTGFTIGLDLAVNPPTCVYCSISGNQVFDSATGKCRCANNYFLNTTAVPPVCSRCTDPLCLTCSATACTTCVANAANNGPGTPCVCNSGFYPGAGGVCIACPIGCTTCTSATSCQSCDSTPGTNRLPAAQGCICAPRFYEVPGQVVCQACAPYCLTCSGTATNCLTCNSAAFLVPSSPVGSCVCATGYYYLDPAVRQCVPCSPICQTCSGSSIYCLTCKPGSNRTLSFIDSTSTYKTCKCDTANGYVQLNYECVDSKCRDLDPYCQNCAVDTFTLAKRCIDCVGDRSYNGTACVCNSGFYTATDGSCVACGLGCQVCNSTACITCANRATLNSNGVTCTCPSNTFLLTTSSGVYCSPCSSNCLSCANSSTSCSACRNGFTLNSTNGCECTGSTYLSQDGQSCISCMLNCQTCQNGTACDVCSPQYAYDTINRICTLNCLPGTYSNGLACVACAAGCAVCTNSWLCQSCTNGYNLYAGACFEDCPTGSYASGGFCLGCPSQCADCDSATVCTACNDPYVLLVNSCLNDCPNGTFFAAGSCRACNQTCATCRGFSTYCLTCPPPRIPYNNSCYTTCPVATVNNTCTDVCPAGTFLNGTVCQQCLAPCRTCVGTASNCTSCTTGFSQNGQCINSCPAGTFGSGGFCAACDVSCQTCQVNAFQCIQCATGFTRSGFNCIRSCQSGFFFNTTTQSCQSCGPGCRICTSATLCTTCINPAVIPTNGMCQQPCPTGAQVVGAICVCNIGVLHQNICITACPAGFFANTNRICVACTAPCANCTTSSTNCTSCQLGYNFNSTTRTCTQASQCGYGQYRSDAGVCTNICTTGFYFNTGCICQCPPGYQNNTSGGCIQTINPTFCTFPLIQHGSSCVASCPVGFCIDYNARTCIRCMANCVSCLSSTYCIACANGYILNGDQSACILSNSCLSNLYQYNTGCLPQCPEGTYQAGRICVPSCPSGTYYHNGLCYSTCPTSYYTNQACYSQCPSGYSCQRNIYY